jgi:hypothetical protein
MPIKLVRSNHELPAQDDPTLVGQAEWCHLIPTLHRILANPSEAVEMPQIYKHMKFSEACAYWETAVYLLRFLLDWRDPGTGLQWWYRNNQEDLGDPRLTLLNQVWNSEGQLDLLAAWFWEHGQSANDRRGQDFLGKAWWDIFQRTHSNKPIYDHDPYHGGYNALHLGHSGSLPCSGSDLPTTSIGTLLRSDLKERKCVLILDEARGWYDQLILHGETLPPLDNQSWHIDVVVKPMGWLGTFRQSRKTGLWFQGRHLIHVAGN